MNGTLFEAEGEDKISRKIIIRMMFYADNFEKAVNYVQLYTGLKLDSFKNCKWTIRKSEKTKIK